MADLHIADFYKDTARVLVQLYNSFPLPIMIFVEDIAGPDQPDEFGVHSRRHQACLASLLWLSQMGYMSYQSLIRQEAVDQACLTQRGFTLLASPLPMQEVVGLDLSEQQAPEPGLGSATGISLLREVLHQGSSDATGQVVLELLRQARHHL